MADKKVELKVSANVDAAVAGIKKLEGAVGNAGKVGELFGSSMGASMGQVSGALSTVSSAFSGMGAMAGAALGPIALVALAIGAVISVVKGLSNYIGEAITRTVEWGKENKKLATVLGITAQEAAALNIAIDDSFSTTDAYLGAVNKLTKTIAQHPELFRQLKVNLKDSNGEYRKTNDVMQDTLLAFSKMPDSLERNIAMQKVFGKSWQDMLPFLDIAEKMDSARKEVEKFGLATNDEDVKKYREALDDAGDVFDYLKIAVGINLMPVMTELLSVFGEIGKGVLPDIIWGIKYFAIGVSLAWAEIQQMTLQLGVLIGYLEIAYDLLMSKVDWASPVKSMGKAFDDATDKMNILHRGFKIISEDIENKSNKRAFDIVMAGQGSPKDDKDDKDKRPPDDDDRTDLQRFKDLFEQKKAIELAAAVESGQARQLSAKEELALLEETAKAFKFNRKDQAQVDQMALQLKLKVHKEEYDQKMALYDLDIAKAKGNYEEQKKIAEKRLEDAKHYGAKEALEAEKKLEELKQKQQDEIKKVTQLKEDAVRNHAKAQIAAEDLITDNLLKNHAISGEQAIEMKRATQERLFQMELQSLQDRLAIQGLELSEKQKINNDIEALQDQHNQRMLGLNLQLNDELQQGNGWAGAVQSAQTFIDQSQNSFQMWGDAVTSVLQGAKSAFAGFFESIFESGKTGAQKWDALWKALVKTVIQSIAQLIANWVVGKIAAAIFGDSVADAAKTQAVASQQAAASATWAAYAGIPFVGPALAAAQIVLMNASLVANLAAAKASTKAYAVGGLIDKPTMALMGEAGPELVAPERDFKYWAKSLVFAGSELQSQIMARQASTMNYSKLASSYPQAAIEAAEQSKPQNTVQITINALDPLQAAKSVKEAMDLWNLNYA